MTFFNSSKHIYSNHLLDLPFYLCKHITFVYSDKATKPYYYTYTLFINFPVANLISFMPQLFTKYLYKAALSFGLAVKSCSDTNLFALEHYPVINLR